MSSSSNRGVGRPRRPIPSAALPPPPGLRGKQFEVDGEEYAVLVYPLPKPSAPVSASLTPAEAAVVALVLRGFSNEEIAAVRSSSSRTVANQLQAVYRKLGVASRVELAHTMAQRGGAQ